MAINPIALIEKQFIKIYELYASLLRNTKNIMSADEVNTAYSEYEVAFNYDFS